MLAAVFTCTAINWTLPSCLASYMGDAKGGFTFFACSHPFLAYPLPDLTVTSAPLPCSPRCKAMQAGCISPPKNTN